MDRFLDLWWAAQSARWQLFAEFWWLPVGIAGAAALYLIVLKIGRL